jgi:hypothetical protein
MDEFIKIYLICEIKGLDAAVSISTIICFFLTFVIRTVSASSLLKETSQPREAEGERESVLPLAFSSLGRFAHFTPTRLPHMSMLGLKMGSP